MYKLKLIHSWIIYNKIGKKMKKQVSVLGKRTLFEEKPKKLLEAILADWQNEAEITKEQKYGRQKAAKRIRECSKNKSIKLNLSRLKLGSLPAGIFEHLTQLKNLNLRCNQLNSLPDQLFEHLKQLAYLDLSANRFRFLTENLFKGLTELTHLYLCVNKLSTLPKKSIYEFNTVRSLSLGNNQLSRLPDNLFKRLKKLENLSLNWNHLDRLPSEIGQLHQLKHLFLTGNDHIKMPLSILELNIDFGESKVLYYAVTQTINNNTPENRELMQRLLNKPTIEVSIDEYKQALQFESTSKDSRISKLIETHVLDSSKNDETRDNTLYTHCLRQMALRLWKSSATSSLITLSKTLNGHIYWVKSVAVSPDGTRVVSGSEDRTIKIWDAHTRMCLQTLRGHTDFVNSVAVSPDGTQIVSGSWDKTIKIWDATTGNCLQTLNGHNWEVTSISFSPDGTQIVSGSELAQLKFGMHIHACVYRP